MVVVGKEEHEEAVEGETDEPAAAAATWSTLFSLMCKVGDVMTATLE